MGLAPVTASIACLVMSSAGCINDSVCKTACTIRSIRQFCIEPLDLRLVLDEACSDLADSLQVLVDLDTTFNLLERPARGTASHFAHQFI